MKCFRCGENHERWKVLSRRRGKAGDWYRVECGGCGSEEGLLISTTPAVLRAAQALESSVRDANGAGPQPVPLNTDLGT